MEKSPTTDLLLIFQKRVYSLFTPLNAFQNQKSKKGLLFLYLLHFFAYIKMHLMLSEKRVIHRFCNMNLQKNTAD